MDVSGELARRISRRQFLFGGRNSGGGRSETGVLGTVLGAAGLGVGGMALRRPGPNVPCVQHEFPKGSPQPDSAHRVLAPISVNEPLTILVPSGAVQSLELRDDADIAN